MPGVPYVLGDTRARPHTHANQLSRVPADEVVKIPRLVGTLRTIKSEGDAWVYTKGNYRVFSFPVSDLRVVGNAKCESLYPAKLVSLVPSVVMQGRQFQGYWGTLTLP